MNTQFLDNIQAIRVLNFDWRCERNEKPTTVCVAKPVLVPRKWIVLKLHAVCRCWQTKKYTQKPKYERAYVAYGARVCARYKVVAARCVCTLVCVHCACHSVCIVRIRYSKHVMRFVTHSSSYRDKRYSHQMYYSSNVFFFFFFWRDSSTSSTSQPNAFHIQHSVISVFCMQKRNVTIVVEASFFFVMNRNVSSEPFVQSKVY